MLIVDNAIFDASGNSAKMEQVKKKTYPIRGSLRKIAKTAEVSGNLEDRMAASSKPVQNSDLKLTLRNFLIVKKQLVDKLILKKKILPISKIML